MNVQLPTTLPDTSTTPASTGGNVTRPVSTQALPAETQTANAQSQTAKPTPEQVQKALDNLKRITQPVAQNLQFSVDESTGQTVIRVVDEITKDVIRQIPSQEVLDLAKSLDKLSGLLLSQKA